MANHWHTQLEQPNHTVIVGAYGIICEEYKSHPLMLNNIVEP